MANCLRASWMRQYDPSPLPDLSRPSHIGWGNIPCTGTYRPKVQLRNRDQPIIALGNHAWIDRYSPEVPLG
jgi:hypothetical protein